jgi:hypothetical protein
MAITEPLPGLGVRPTGKASAFRTGFNETDRAEMEQQAETAQGEGDGTVGPGEKKKKWGGLLTGLAV